jgi:hypothetical protein
MEGVKRFNQDTKGTAPSDKNEQIPMTSAPVHSYESTNFGFGVSRTVRFFLPLPDLTIP